MPQAIETKFIPATNTRPARIKARCSRGSITIPWPEQDMDQEALHRYAARMLADRFVTEDEKQYGKHRNPWAGAFVTGSIESLRDGYVHVFSDWTGIVIEPEDFTGYDQLRKTIVTCQETDHSLRPLDSALLASVIRKARSV